jgi:tetratricopeptide (TPR) repeat protein
MIARLLLIFLLLSNLSSASPYTFDYSRLCDQAYKHYLSLQLDEGTNVLRKELIANPYNLMATYIADYEDCLILMMNGDPKDYQQRSGHMEARLALLSKGDGKSPWQRWCKAGIYFHWALIHFRTGENFKAALNFRRSFILLRENKKLFPAFQQNNIFFGAEEAVVGTIPDDYKWLASVFGMKGNVKKGIAQVRIFIQSTPEKEPFKEEAIIYYNYLRFYLLSQQQEVWNYVNSKAFPVQSNLFYSFIKANIALNFRKADVAITVLKAAQAIPAFKKYPILEYELASALLHKLDPEAISYLKPFISNYTGKFFMKDAIQKLAISYYISGNMNSANYYKAEVLKAGSKQVDADKQAHRFASIKGWPSLHLMQARLLTDGGYYNEAIQKLSGFNVSQAAIAEQLEYYFRSARIYEETGNKAKAIEYYETTIKLGSKRQEHFAARSALQLGRMFEKTGSRDKAVRMYKQCLAMKNHDYQANIDQQAKAGINRLAE